jgi:hypothetical protein
MNDSLRNHGCRYLSFDLHGCRTVILENDRVRTMILLDKGAEVVEFVHKSTDTDFLWRSPLGLGILRNQSTVRKDSQQLTDAYTGGWFECFPSTGQPCQALGADISFYGEVCYLPWEMDVVEDTALRVALKCSVRLVKTPFRLERTFRMEKGKAEMWIEERIVNLGREMVPYQWGHHPNFGAPFLSGTAVIRSPSCIVEARYDPVGYRHEIGSRGIWPWIKGKDGGPVDLSRVGSEGSGINEVVDLLDLSEGWFELLRPDLGLGLRLDWDLGMFPHSAIWHVCNGDTGYPRYGDTYVLGLVLRSDETWGLSDGIERGTVRTLAPGAEASTWLRIGIV